MRSFPISAFCAGCSASPLPATSSNSLRRTKKSEKWDRSAPAQLLPVAWLSCPPSHCTAARSPRSSTLLAPDPPVLLRLLPLQETAWHSWRAAYRTHWAWWAPACPPTPPAPPPWWPTTWRHAASLRQVPCNASIPPHPGMLGMPGQASYCSMETYVLMWSLSSSM